MSNEIKDYAQRNRVPIIKDGALNRLKDIIKENNHTNILELGSAIGYSSIELAKTSPVIHIDTIERDPDLYKIALNNIKANNLQDQISIYHMDIKDFKPLYNYDLIFVDASKAHYKEYLEKFIDYLAPWGVMFFDNMAFHGMVKDNTLTHNRHTLALVKKLKEFREYVQDDERFVIMLDDDIADGILELRRRY